MKKLPIKSEKKADAKKSMSLRLDLHLYRKVQKEAEMNGVSVSDQIRFYLLGVATPSEPILKSKA